MDFGNHRKPVNNGGRPYCLPSDHRLKQTREAERAEYSERKRMFTDFEDEKKTEQEYRGYRLTYVNYDHLHIAITTADGSPLPKRLDGVWTSVDQAKREIDAITPGDKEEKIYE